ncbi:aspartate/glutamate racemase family protein [Rhizobium gallicum]|uniref:aspartate/glutamate racemase family protein n=1 Tax=Rhizobium gallicum TaxID=56730 RepID=UPI0012EB6DA0|nr:aspartate/glutamate racemase family protein [Rhizobium gallicum]
MHDLPVYAEALAAHLPKVASEGTEVIIHGAQGDSYRGHAPAEVLRYPYLRHRIQEQIFRHCLQAENEGFGAIALASFGEPFLDVCRSIVTIPIASMPESCMLVGCSMARRMALITLTPKNVHRVRTLVENHTLSARVSGVYSLEPAVTEADLAAAFDAPDAILRNYIAVAERAVAEGADLVAPAEGVLNELLYAHGVSRIGGVSNMDTIAVVIRYAEMLAGLSHISGLSVGREWTYAQPNPALLREFTTGPEQG